MLSFYLRVGIHSSCLLPQENCQKNLSAKRRALSQKEETWRTGEKQEASKEGEEGEEEEVVVDAGEATAVAEVEDVEQEATIMAQAKLEASAETEDGKNYGKLYRTWTRK